MTPRTSPDLLRLHGISNREYMWMGLVYMYLDMVRMEMGWTKDTEDVVDVYVKELGELWEENRLLREENERLKRGY